MKAVLLTAHTKKIENVTKQSHFRIGVDRFQMLCDR